MKILIILSLFTCSVFAQDRSPDAAKIDEKAETEISSKVKNKIYPGGKDETPLKVQPTLVMPTRKITPTVEDSSDGEAEHD